jgi:hypothetical protein
VLPTSPLILAQPGPYGATAEHTLVTSSLGQDGSCQTRRGATPTCAETVVEAAVARAPFLPFGEAQELVRLEGLESVEQWRGSGGAGNLRLYLLAA